MLGNILKFKRLEKNIKQDELCQGICTPSYLSRIENNRLVADEEIYKLLFKRLGMNFEEVLKINSETDERIEQWYQDILGSGNSNEVIDELERISQISGGELFLKFEIVHSRYLLMDNQMDCVEKKLPNIHEVIEKSYNRNFFLYSNVLLLYFLKKKEYSSAIESATELLKIEGYELLGNDTELGIFFHNLALSYKNLYLYEKGNFYANRALTIFKDNYDLEKAMNCHIISGTCLINLSKWDAGIRTYTLAKKLLFYLPERLHPYYLKMIRNNLGNCFEYQGKYQEAIHYYLQSINYIEKDEMNIPLLNLVRCYYYLGEYKEAKLWLDKALKEVNIHTPKVFRIQHEIFAVLMSEDLTVDKIINIEKSSIDYFLSNKKWKLTKRYCVLFAQLYEDFGSYKKANSMHKLAFQINKSTGEMGIK